MDLVIGSRLLGIDSHLLCSFRILSTWGDKFPNSVTVGEINKAFALTLANAAKYALIVVSLIGISFIVAPLDK